MTSVLARLYAEAGITEAPKSSLAGQFFAREGVKPGPEFLRIRTLPRRDWEKAEDLDKLIDLMTEWLGRGLPAVPGSFNRLNAMQAAALRELHDLGRCCVVANVGSGKSGVAALAPTVLDAKRPLFITYKKLLAKTVRDFRILAENWRVAQNYTFISAESLSNKSGAEALERYQPDLVVCDECFVAGTQIETPHGRTPIEALKPGDLVLTAGGAEVVVGARSREADILCVTVGDVELFTTHSHPFLTQRGWVSAVELTCDDYCVRAVFSVSDRETTNTKQPFLFEEMLGKVATQSAQLRAPYERLGHPCQSGGEHTSVLPHRAGVSCGESLIRAYVLQQSDEEDRIFGTYRLARVSRVERLRSRQTVYNLEVSGTHTYVANGVVVHNCHLFKSLKSTRTRRMDRYMEAHPECKFLPLTGTPGDESVTNIAHIQRWVHGPDNVPLPQNYIELSSWADALDATVMVRTAPGCLSEFAGGSILLADVRAGVGARIAQTPGNIYFRDDSVACSLYLDAHRLEEVGPEIDKTFAYVREHEDEMPDGRVIDTPIERWRTFYTLGLGFVHVIDPPPPKDWREARRLYNAFVREVLTRNEPGLDQPLLVGEACARGIIDSGGLYEAWKEIEPTFKVHSKIVWYDDSALKYCAKWAKDHHGLVWTPYPAFGKKLAELTGLPFFHQQGVCAKHGLIDEYHGKTSAVVSTQANAMGRNLQDRWNKMLIVAPSAKSDLLEQQIGRVHRQGQLAESVEITFLLSSIETWEALQKARYSRSEFDKDFGQARGSKLRGCDWLVADGSEVAKWRGPRWSKAK